MKNRLTLLATVLSGLFSLPAAAGYSFITLDAPGDIAPPGFINTQPSSINASGQVVGSYGINGAINHGFLYSGGVFTTLDAPGSLPEFPFTIANSINASGQVAGEGARHSFVYSGGVFTTFDSPGWRTAPNSINASGQVAGSYYSGMDSHGFVYSGGEFTTLDVPGAKLGSWGWGTQVSSINDGGQVAGSYADSSGKTHGFVESGGVFTTLDVPWSPDTMASPWSWSPNTMANSINASGQVAGSYNATSYGYLHGFVYSGGMFTILNVPGSFETIATGINASAQVAGSYQDASGWHGFVYSSGEFTTLDAPAESRYVNSSSINDSGQVVGYYTDAYNHYHGFIASAAPVPEPEEYLMLLLGFGMVGYQVKRKQRSLSLAQ